MNTALDLDAIGSAETLRLAGLGEVVVHEVRDHRRLALVLEDRAPGRATSVVDELVVLSTDLSSSRLRLASEANRRRLRPAIARVNQWEREWKSQYGSHLSADERLVTSAVTGRGRQQDEVRLRLRALAKRRASLAETKPATVSAGAASGPARAMMGNSKWIRQMIDPFAGMRSIMATQGIASRAARGAYFPAQLRGLVQPLAIGKFRAQAAGFSKLARPLDPAGNLQRQIARGLQRNVARPTSLAGLPESMRGAHVVAGLTSGFGSQALGAAALNSFRAPLGGIVRPFDFTSRLETLLNPLTWLQDELAGLGRFLDTWQDDSLWFLLSLFRSSASRSLAILDHEHVRAALLHAIEAVVREGHYVAALRDVVAEAVDLTEAEREHLDHALEHAEKGEWRHAVTSFHPGFEGALWQAGLRRNLVVVKRGKFQAAELVLKAVVASEEDYIQFVVRHVFGGAGNTLRHGRASTGEREVMLCGIVALAGWIDHFMGLSSMEVLVGELEPRLDAAIEATGEPVAIETAAA